MKQLRQLFVAATMLCCLPVSMFAAAPSSGNLFAIGGPFNARGLGAEAGKWDLFDAVQLEKDADNPAVFYYRGYIAYNTFGENPGQFKFLPGKADWNGSYHPKVQGNGTVVLGADLVGQTMDMSYRNVDGVGDAKWELPSDHSSDGYYSLKIDTENMTFTVESFTAVRCDIPVGLFLAGGPWNEDGDDWGEVSTYRMERDATDPYVFYFHDYMERNPRGDQPGSFKFLVNGRQWANELHPGKTNGVDFSAVPVGEPQKLYSKQVAGDTKWELKEDGSGNGYWEFTVDMKDSTLTINEFKHDFEYFTKLYLVGTPFGSGWNLENMEEMTQAEVGSGIYTWRGMLATWSTDVVADFKILRKVDWHGGQYSALAANTPLVPDESVKVTYVQDYGRYGNDYKFVISSSDAGKEVELTLNLNDSTLLMKQVIGTGLETAETASARVFVHEGKVLLQGMSGENYAVVVFTLDGRQVLSDAFTGETTLSLPQGSYVVTMTDADNHTVKAKVIL